jgi:transposase InsO family protein
MHADLVQLGFDGSYARVAVVVRGWKADRQLAQQTTGRGRYLDNIFIARLSRSLKQEAVYLHELQDGFQAKCVIKDWI